MTFRFCGRNKDLIRVYSVSGSGPTYVIGTNSHGIEVGDHAVLPLKGRPSDDAGIYRVSEIINANSIRVVDDINPSGEEYGEPRRGQGQHYTPTPGLGLSQIIDGRSPYFQTAVRRDAQVIDAGIGPNGTAALAKAAVSENDTYPKFLNQKIVAGTNVVVTENNDGGDEVLTISASGGAMGTDELLKVSGVDTTAGYLKDKLDTSALGFKLVEQDTGGGVQTLVLEARGSTSETLPLAQPLDANDIRNAAAIIFENPQGSVNEFPTLVANGSGPFNFGPFDTLVLLAGLVIEDPMTGTFFTETREIVFDDFTQLPPDATVDDLAGGLGQQFIEGTIENANGQLVFKLTSSPLGWIALSDKTQGCNDQLEIDSGYNWSETLGTPALVQSIGAPFNLTDGDVLDFDTDISAGIQVQFNQGNPAAPAVIESDQSGLIDFSGPDLVYQMETFRGMAEISPPPPMPTYNATQIAAHYQAEVNAAGLGLTVTEENSRVVFTTQDVGAQAVLRIEFIGSGGPTEDPLWDGTPQEAFGVPGTGVNDITAVTAQEFKDLIDNIGAFADAWVVPSSDSTDILLARFPDGTDRETHTIQVQPGPVQIEANLSTDLKTGLAGVGTVEVVLPALDAADNGLQFTVINSFSSASNFFLSGPGVFPGFIEPGNGLTFIWDGDTLKYVQI